MPCFLVTVSEQQRIIFTMPDTSNHTNKVRNFFDDRVGAYDAFYDDPSRFSRWFSRVFRKAVYLRRDQTAILAERYHCRTLLDVGCGSGQNSVWFVRHGIEHVFGLDISGEMIEMSRALAERAGVADRCEFKQEDFVALPEGQRFDMVCALGVFDYVENPEPFLRHMARFANRVVYTSFPGWTLVRSPLRKLRYTLRGCPIRFYRSGEIRALFEAVGFGVVHVKPVPSGYLAWAVKDGVEASGPPPTS